MRSAHPLPIVLSAVVAGVVSSGCPQGEPPAAPAAAPVASPTRHAVVSLSPAASRFVRALGAQRLLVGVDPVSSTLPGLEDLPVVDDLAGAAGLAPDLVLLTSLPDPHDPSAEALRSDGVALIPFVPHNMQDALELVREVGPRLVGAARTGSFEDDLTRPLAAIGGSSFGQPRPRVLAVVGFDPLLVAGGHSFETDLIEIAGGRSVTHDAGEPRLEVGPELWPRLAPDLVLVVTPDEPGEAGRRTALEQLPPEYRVEFFSVDPQRFWLRDAAGTARRLRALIEPVSRTLEAHEANPTPLALEGS